MGDRLGAFLTLSLIIPGLFFLIELFRLIFIENAISPEFGFLYIIVSLILIFSGIYVWLRFREE